MRELSIKPSLDELRSLAATGSPAGPYRAVPLYASLPEATRDPLELFRVLKGLSRHCYIFESREDPEKWGRYTFLGFDPKAEITCSNNRLRIRNGTTVEVRTDEPGRYIQQMLDEYRSPRLENLPPFTGGLVGYFSYDYIAYSEPSLRRDDATDMDAHTGADARESAPASVPTPASAPSSPTPAPVPADEEGFKDVDLMIFDKVIAYDHLKRRILLIATIKCDDLEENYQRATHELKSLARLVRTGIPITPEPLSLRGPFEALFDEQHYRAMVERAQGHIREGDIFQVVLSNRLKAPAEGSLFDTYRALRRINPSPYMFYFSSDDIEIAGASPETLVKLTEDSVFTFPLAGTRPRGATPVEDAMLEREMLADKKELAEHNMLVDLGRNDLGRVSRFGTVKVENYQTVLRFSHVMHLGSTVSGRLRENKTALDVIDAILPAGTLSGAPKIRACQIISELEGNRRGIYGGAIGYLAFTGDMDTCIAIRLAFKKNGSVFVRSGAGIVADSVPQREYQECHNKLAAVIEALESAKGGAS